MCIAFCDTVENAGYYCGIYANPAWFDGILDKSRLTKYDKWLAHWVKFPKYGNEFGGLWQYGTGRLDSHNGEIDMNISYRDYSSIIKNAGFNGFKKPDKPDISKFDIDGDGKVTSYDALKVLQSVTDK